ncbi:MAG TPA: oligosaccharide flippase family protein, partial [Longimicrobium sp.]|nr:oligosaccharide flippase family protein [Longimicrobium sp.]
IPRIAGGLGPERFGILALAWAAFGYTAVLHLGLGRAVARGAAGGTPGGAELRATVWTGLLMALVPAVAGTAALFALAPALARSLGLHGALAGEAALAFRVLACAVPFTVTAPVLSGVLEARRRFGVVNAVTVPGSLVTYLGPVAVLALARSPAPLVPVMAVLAAARVAMWIGFLLLCLREAPELRAGPTFHGGLARPLLRFGGWLSVSALVSPLLVYLDRFVVAGAVSAAAVAYYAAAQEVVVRAGMVSGAVVGVLFPAFAGVRPGDGRRLARLLESGVDAVLLLVVPLTLLLAAGAELLLRAWLGGAYAQQGAHLLAWFSVGLVVNGLAKMPATLLQGIGRPDLTARLHLAELPAFVLVLGAAIWAWGIEGAAVAWVARMTVDALGLYWLAWRQVPETRRGAARAAAVAAFAAVGVGALRLAEPPLLRGALLAVAAVALLWAAVGALHRRSADAGLPDAFGRAG